MLPDIPRLGSILLTLDRCFYIVGFPITRWSCVLFGRQPKASLQFPPIFNKVPWPRGNTGSEQRIFFCSLLNTLHLFIGIMWPWDLPVDGSHIPLLAILLSHVAGHDEFSVPTVKARGWPLQKTPSGFPYNVVRAIRHGVFSCCEANWPKERSKPFFFS